MLSSAGPVGILASAAVFTILLSVAYVSCSSRSIAEKN